MFSSFVGSNGLAVIRDVEDPEPAIEAEFSVTGIGPNKMDLSRLEVLGNQTQHVPSTAETHPDTFDTSTVLGH